MKKPKVRFTWAELTAEILTLKAQMEIAGVQMPLMASLRGHRELEARVAALDNWRKEFEKRAAIGGEEWGRRLAALEAAVPSAKHTPPPAPDGFELTGEYKCPTGNDIWEDAGLPGHICEARNGRIAEKRWIIRKLPVAPKNISIELTEKEWDEFLSKTHAEHSVWLKAQKQFEAAKH